MIVVTVIDGAWPVTVTAPWAGVAVAVVFALISIPTIRQFELVTFAAPAVLNEAVSNRAAAPVAGVLKFPAAPAVSVHDPEAVGALFASETTNVIARFRALAAAESVTVAAVPVPVFVALLATIACAAVPLFSWPVISNSISRSPVPFVLVTVATGATEVGLAPALATQHES